MNISILDVVLIFTYFKDRYDQIYSDITASDYRPPSPAENSAVPASGRNRS